jgi:SAM-dependent methyltransferase
MFKNMLKIGKEDNLGLELNAGDRHYRAYVGPPKDYDLISAMVFNLITCIGLRQHHKVLDIGCGSLRVGRLLIPFLNKGNYVGIEPNKWLVTQGIKNEVGKDLIRIKEPVFSFQSSLVEFKKPLAADYAIAQSVFSHCGVDLITKWLEEVSRNLKDTGVFLATFLKADDDFKGFGWIYPECVNYRAETMARMAAAAGLHFEMIDWAHPRQIWAIFAKNNYDRCLIEDGQISWNKFIEKAKK